MIKTTFSYIGAFCMLAIAVLLLPFASEARTSGYLDFYDDDAIFDSGYATLKSVDPDEQDIIKPLIVSMATDSRSTGTGTALPDLSETADSSNVIEHRDIVPPDKADFTKE